MACAILACAVLALAACTAGPAGAPGSSASGGAPAGSISTPSSAAAPSTPASASADGSLTVAACRTADLAVSVTVDPGRHAAGSTYYPIVFTNTGGSPCILSGTPEVGLAASRGGNLVGQPASGNGTAATAVTLPPGGAAHAILQVSNADVFDAKACGPVDPPHWLRVTPPGQTAPIFVAFTLETKACTLGGQLGISPISTGNGS